MSRYDYGYYGFTYVPVAQKKAEAMKRIEKLRKKNKNIQPIEPFNDRKIAHSFWGQSWCDNMEQYADYENRLPRGKSYLRHGCVCDLQISEGLVTAMVSGSSLYNVRITIDKLSDKRSEMLQNLLQGRISSQLELLQGKIPKDVKELVGNPDNGIIPFPKEIHMHCSCPDSASLCKHLAAVLYGIGRRLDSDPGVLFTLRGLDPVLLCANANEIDFSVGESEENLSGDEDLSALFGIDLGTMGDEQKAGDSAIELTESTAAAPKAEEAAPAKVKAGRKKTASAAEAPVAAPKAEKTAPAKAKAGRKKTVPVEAPVAAPKAEEAAPVKAKAGRKKTAPVEAPVAAPKAEEAAPVKAREETVPVQADMGSAVAPFDPKNPTVEGLQALCELAGHTPQEVSYLAGIGYTTFKSWLDRKGPLVLMPRSIEKLEKYQKRVLKARARAKK